MKSNIFATQKVLCREHISFVRVRCEMSLGGHVVVYIVHKNRVFPICIPIFSRTMMTNGNICRVTGPSQGPVMQRFDIFFDLRLIKRLSKQSGRWWFEKQSRSLWRHCDNDPLRTHTLTNMWPIVSEFGLLWIFILTHWGRDQIDTISQTTFSNAFSRMKMNEFRLEFHWSLFLRLELTIFQHWFNVSCMTYVEQDYLNAGIRSWYRVISTWSSLFFWTALYYFILNYRIINRTQGNGLAYSHFNGGITIACRL